MLEALLSLIVLILWNGSISVAAAVWLDEPAVGWIAFIALMTAAAAG